MRRSLFALLLLAAALPAPALARERWDTRVLARVGQPGFPAHAYVHPNERIYEGTYVNSNSREPSRVIEYAGDGTLLRQWTLHGQALGGEQGVQVATSDALGRLVLLDHSPPRAVLLDRATGAQHTYATFPAGAIPNYAAWGPGGELYVTDYANNQVWRVPRGGGTPEVWLTDRVFTTVEFGMTGIELGADQKSLLITQQTLPTAGIPVSGGLFEVGIGSDGKPTGLQQIWSSSPLDLPDGFAIARSGRIYVATLGPNQIVTLNPQGAEQERWPPLPLLGENGTHIPFDALSSVAFRGTSLITASQSNPQANPDHWAIHDVEVGEPGLPELIPANAGLRPGEFPPGTRIALKSSRTRVRAGARVRLTFTATALAKPLPGAVVRFAGRRATTDTHGRARLTVRLRRTGVRRAIVSYPGTTRGRVSIRVTRR